MRGRSLVCLSGAIAIAACGTVTLAGHDVTTKVTWNREISRIVYARCAQCHQPGSSAFSLLTFQDANPWAQAIRDSVLRRTMPPWGAVKGFGTFRNEQALSQEELGLVENWVNGGAPEGNPNDLPPSARIAAVPPETSASAALIARDRFTFAGAFVLDGFRVEPAGNIEGAQITVAFPDGRVAPLVWLHNYSASTAHVFLLRRPLAIAPGAELRGIPAGAALELLAAGPTKPRR
jgi:mono/diheme cytochrome c family protein